MDGIFKKVSKNDQGKKGFMATVAGSLYGRLKSRCSHWLNIEAAKMSPRSLTALLVMFVLLFGSYCAGLVLGAFDRGKNREIAVHQINRPMRENRSAERLNGKMSRVEIEKLKAFRMYIDSLKGSTSGRIEYDSFVAAHPGLLDSLAVIERNNYYQSK